MNKKTMLVLAGVLIVLGVLVVLKNQSNETPTIIEQVKLTPLVPEGTTKAGVTRIELHNGGAAEEKLALERDELLRQVEHMTSQLATIEGSTAAPVRQHANAPSLSEAFFLERERERAVMVAVERQAERERLERAERERLERAERAERERIERVERESARERAEARLTVVAFAVGTCTCGLGATVLGATLLVISRTGQASS